MSLKIVILCVCLQLLAIGTTSDTLRANDSNFICESRKHEKSSVGPEVGEYPGNLEGGIATATDNFVSAFNVEEIEKQEQGVLGSLWLQLPLLPIAYANSSSLPDGPCKKQALQYLRELKKNTLWAAQMYDASTKFPEGIIAGHTRHLGNFDLCYNLKTTLARYDDVETLGEEEIAGRHCLVDIEYEKQNLPPVDPTEQHGLQFDPHGSVWEAIREKGDFIRLKRYVLQMALCVPEVCTAADIEAALREPFDRAATKQNIQFNVSVEPKFCQARKEAPKFSGGAKIYCSVLVGLFLIVAFSTWYDYSLQEYKENDDSMVSDLVLCFSARRNCNTLMKITSGHPGLEVLNLIRVFYMIGTLMAHRIMEYSAAPLVNVSYAESLYRHDRSALVLGASVIIHGFHSIGGLLVSYSALVELDKKKKLNFLGALLIRYLRLTPAYALVVFFNMLVLPHLGSGPYWEWKIGLERDSCANNWWANLLYINNYVNPERICMFQSWYLAADYHLFMLALVGTYAFWRMPRKLGYPFLILIILGGCTVPFVNSYRFGVSPLYVGMLNMREVREHPSFTGHYIKTHERISSYFIGVLAGAIVHDHGRNPWRLGKVASHISFFFFVVVLGLWSLLSAQKFLDPNRNPGVLVAALHTVFAGSASALSLGAAVVLITAGQGLSLHYNFLAPRWVQPFARITYSVYLVHGVIQLYALGVTRTARQYSVHNVFLSLITDTVIASFLAFLLYLTVEEPFRRIEKRFITKREKSESSKKVKAEVKKSS